MNRNFIIKNGLIISDSDAFISSNGNAYFANVDTPAVTTNAITLGGDSINATATDINKLTAVSTNLVGDSDTQELRNKTLLAPVFSTGTNSPYFTEIRFNTSNIMKYNQMYTGASSGSYFSNGEYQKVVTITPSGNAQNYQIVGRITAQSASSIHTVNFNVGLRSNTLPDLSFTGTYTEDHNGTRMFTPFLWTKETSTAGFIFGFQTHITIYGTVTVDFEVIPRTNGQLDNVDVNSVQNSEQSSIDSGFTNFTGFKKITEIDGSNITYFDSYTLPNADGTAGQILQTDGNGSVTFADKQGIGGTGISRSHFGSANEVIVVDSDGTGIVSTTTLSIDDANSRIGIGTSSPDVKFHIRGEADQEAQIRMEQFNNTTDAPDIRTKRARGTADSPSSVNAGDYLFRFNIEGHDGTDFQSAGQFRWDANSDDNSPNSVFGLQTRVNGSTNDRLTINKKGQAVFYDKILPSSNVSFDIGDSDAKWNNVYVGGKLLLDNDFDVNNIIIGNTIRVDSDGAGLRMTNVGAFDRSGNNFRIFSNNDLVLSVSGQNGTAVTFDKSSKDATFTGRLMPNTTHQDIGDSDMRWRDLYLSGSTADIGGVQLKNDGSNNLDVTDKLGNRKSIKAIEVEIGATNKRRKLKIDTKGRLTINEDDDTEVGIAVDSEVVDTLIDKRRFGQRLDSDHALFQNKIAAGLVNLADSDLIVGQLNSKITKTINSLESDSIVIQSLRTDLQSEINSTNTDVTEVKSRLDSDTIAISNAKNLANDANTRADSAHDRLDSDATRITDVKDRLQTLEDAPSGTDSDSVKNITKYVANTLDSDDFYVGEDSYDLYGIDSEGNITFNSIYRHADAYYVNKNGELIQQNGYINEWDSEQIANIAREHGGSGGDTSSLVARLDSESARVSSIFNIATFTGKGFIPNINSNGTTGYTLGDSDAQWKDLFVSQGSIYVNNKKVLEDDSGTITVRTDENQHLTIKTEGTGITSVKSEQQVAITTTGSGDVTLTTDTGNIELKGTVEILSGKRITDSAGTNVQFGDPIHMNNNKITNVGTPTAASDVATKGYVDTSAGFDSDQIVTIINENVVETDLSGVEARLDSDHALFQDKIAAGLLNLADSDLIIGQLNSKISKTIADLDSDSTALQSVNTRVDNLRADRDSDRANPFENSTLTALRENATVSTNNDFVIRTNPNRLSSDITIDSDTNGVMVGPITIDSDVTLTINGVLVII